MPIIFQSSIKRLGKAVHLKIPLQANLAARHLASTLREKQRARQQVIAMTIGATGPMAPPLLLCLLVWLQPNIPAMLQICIFWILHGWCLIWLMCNQEGIDPSNTLDWSRSFSVSNRLRGWIASLQCWTLHKYLLATAIVLVVIAYAIPMDKTLGLYSITENLNPATDNPNRIVAFRTLLVTIFLLIGQWLYLARLPYRLILASVILAPIAIFYGSQLIATAFLLVELVIVWFAMGHFPIKASKALNDEKWLKLSFNIRVLIGAFHRNPSLWAFPMANISVLGIFLVSIFYFKLYESKNPLLIIQLMSSGLLIAISWQAQKALSKNLKCEGAFILSLPSNSNRLNLTSKLIWSITIPSFLIIWFTQHLYSNL